MRLQRLRLRIAGLRFTVKYVKGSTHFSADCLSRAPLPISSSDIEIEEVVNDFTIGYINALQVSDEKLALLVEKQRNDPVLSKVIEYTSSGWPSKVPISLKQYHSVASELSVVDNLLCKGTRIVIPECLIPDTLERIHEGHQGILRCIERARSTVRRPVITFVAVL